MMHGESVEVDNDRCALKLSRPKLGESVKFNDSAIHGMNTGGVTMAVVKVG